MFFDIFEDLCQRKGVKPGRACSEMGFSRSLAAKWKATGTERPSADVLEKMSIYFKMSIDEILGSKKETPTEPAGTSDDDLKFALFGTTEIDDETLDDIKAYARFKKEQHNKR